MSGDQATLFAILLAVFAMLLWGRVRYDLVAFGALLAGVVAGVVPVDDAFSGFGHPATIIIALVLIVSRALSNSGAVELLARWVSRTADSLFGHISVMSAVAALLSAVMNNVAALALLMPVDIKAANKAGRSPALSLMPLSFASILGGMITLIGTPPNIIVSAIREDSLGEPYRMLDFAPVGIACAVVGVIFVSLIGWRLLPRDRMTRNTSRELFELGDYIAELVVTEGSAVIGRQVRELDGVAESHGVAVIGLVRRGRRLPGGARRVELEAGDTLVIEADAKSIDGFKGEAGLEFSDGGNGADNAAGRDLAVVEAVVPPGARIQGRSARSMFLLERYGVTLLGVSRQGRRFRERIRGLSINAGDVLLLIGPEERIQAIVEWIGALPLASRDIEVIQRNKAGIAAAIFGAAILSASVGWLYLPVALGIACVLFVLLGVVPGRQVYDSVEWPVIVLLGSMIPLGDALETTGGTDLLVALLLEHTRDMGPVAVLALFMIGTMTLSDVLNNTATTIIAAPIGIGLASQLGVDPDPFLMAVAVAASCAFLTPIGHKNNTLILGPGGYRFGDYWRMGLPLEILIVAVGVPAILWVWPL